MSTNGDPYVRIKPDGTTQEQIHSLVGPAAAGTIVARGADAKIAVEDMPTGIGPDTESVTASEALSANDLVNIWSSGGLFKARKADGGTVGKPADGFVLAAVLSGATAVVYRRGANTGLAGLLPGRYWLSGTTPGAITQSPPTAVGKTWQPVGVAPNATTLDFQAGEPIEYA